MRATSSAARRAAGLIVGFIALLVAVTLPADQRAGASTVEIDFDVITSWIDPASDNGFGLPYFSTGFTFPPYPAGVDAVAEVKVPRELAGNTECVVTALSPAEGWGSVTCTVVGAPAVGEHLIVVSIKGDRAAVYDGALPVVVCPPSGCSPLFAVTVVTSTSIEVCPDERFDRVLRYDFNLAWNASGAALADAAPSWATFDAGVVRDGGEFSIAGAVSEPGEYSIPIIVTDEFGGEHATSVAMRVLEPAAGSCGMLAATGSNDQVFLLGIAAVTLIIAGVSVSTRRRACVPVPYDSARSGSATRRDVAKVTE